MSKKKNTNDCHELKNIQYKTLLMKGTNLKPSDNTNNLSNIDVYLTNETETNKLEPWNKLSKTDKINKINTFVDEKQQEYDLNETETLNFRKYLHDCIDKKKIIKNNDVLYNKETGILENIINIQFNSTNKTFLIKKIDKKSNTLKGLPKKHLISNSRIHNQTHKKNIIHNNKDNKDTKDNKDNNKDNNNKD